MKMWPERKVNQITINFVIYNTIQIYKELVNFYLFWLIPVTQELTPTLTPQPLKVRKC